MAPGARRRRATTPKSHFLFLQIIARVSRSKRGITVKTIARDLETRPDVIAHCIALHLYLEQRRGDLLNFPLPNDYWVPRPDDVISPAMLYPSPPRDTVHPVENSAEIRETPA